MHSQAKFEAWLKTAMRSNGVFSIISGLVFILRADPLSEFMGLTVAYGTTSATTLFWIGVLVLLFAAGLFINAAREKPKLTEARLAVFLDFGWVIGSAVILFGRVVPLTAGGWWLVAAIADVVAIFALWQFSAIRKITSASEMKTELRGTAI